MGKERDCSALAVVERAEVFLDEMDWATYERKRVWRYRVRYLQRVKLGTPYSEVVTRVRTALNHFTLLYGDRIEAAWNRPAR